jgi:hypothetical protein
MIATQSGYDLRPAPHVWIKCPPIYELISKWRALLQAPRPGARAKVRHLFRDRPLHATAAINAPETKSRPRNNSPSRAGKESQVSHQREEGRCHAERGRFAGGSPTDWQRKREPSCETAEAEQQGLIR